MKKGIAILVVLVLVGVLGAAWWWARSEPDRAVEALVKAGLGSERAQEIVAGLGGQPAEEEQPLVVSGVIEGKEVTIASEFGGRVVRLEVDEGDKVTAGQVLVVLDSSDLQAQLAQAQAAVAAAEANLANVKAGAHPAEIMAARAALHQAIAERDAAKTAWQDALAILADPQEIQARIVEAQAAVDLAAVQVEQAQAQVAAAQVERDRYRARGSLEEKRLYAVYDYQVQAAQAALEAAQANLEGAKQTLAALEAVRDHPLAVLGQVHMAEGQYRLAAAGVGVALAKLEELQAGPTPEEIAVAEAQVAQAKAAAALVQTQIDMMTLRSPIGGIVTSRSIRAGESALAGATLLTVADLDEVELTVYIPEDELGRVYLGQEVEVTVDSFPGRVFGGTVSYISQQAEFTPKNVQTEKERVSMVFAVKVRLPNPDHALKPGMPADAVLGNR